MKSRNEKETVLDISNSRLSRDGNYMYFRPVFSNCAHLVVKLIELERYTYPVRPVST